MQMRLQEPLCPFSYSCVLHYPDEIPAYFMMMMHAFPLEVWVCGAGPLLCSLLSLHLPVVSRACVLMPCPVLHGMPAAAKQCEEDGPLMGLTERKKREAT
ncbi:hypothetical protein DUNSADRAFT_15623 [Dunaliella salina]|uniref:Encoded protein n=1 Tax=Dunaliella salina TaxID=3046 RepID=A0ABQ7H1P5_DUNSA|nr:hypothetical protein DUNSADRAFT_15623 [Dunaliella salina]|eukprot:KAF5840765.1 hypothetical protein DUNSADRAFT_15623 [Dunaliella salina]